MPLSNTSSLAAATARRNRPKFARAGQMPRKLTAEGYLDESANPEIYLACDNHPTDPIVNVFLAGEPVQVTLRVAPKRKVRYIPSQKAFVEYFGREILSLTEPLSHKAMHTLRDVFGIPSADR